MRGGMSMTDNLSDTLTPATQAARWIKILFGVALALCVVGVYSGVLQIDLISRAFSDGITEEEANINDLRQQVIGILQLIVIIGTMIAFLVWFYRVYGNLLWLGGRHPEYTPGWAVGGFFVPFLNLVRPFQIMREVWHGSDPSPVDEKITSGAVSIQNKVGTPPLVGWWWALFLLSSFLGNIIMRRSFAENQTLDDLHTLSMLEVVSDVLDIPAIILAVRLVDRITGWQIQRAERLRQVAAMMSPGTMPSGE
jgi:hypothetical protein